jgi:hypothetical protein
MTPQVKQQLKDIAHFPVMIGALVLQLIYHVCTEVETFLLAVASTLLGYELGWVWGITIFVSTYFIVRMLGGYVGLLASKLDWIGASISRGNK